jgi:hypothetical protein
MVGAAAAPSDASTTSLASELEETLGRFAALPVQAQKAVASVASGVTNETTVSDKERALALAVVALAQAVEQSRLI